MTARQRVQREKLLKIFKAYANGVSLDVACDEVGIKYSADRFLRLVKELDLGIEWESARQVRASVTDQAEYITSRIPKDKYLSYRKKLPPELSDADKQLEIVLRKASEQQEHKVFFQISMVLKLFSHSQLSLEACVDQTPELNWAKFQQYLISYDIIGEQLSIAVEARKRFAAQLLDSKKIVLFQQAFNSLLDQSVDHVRKEQVKKVEEHQIYNKEGEAIGDSTKTSTTTKELEHKPSAQMLGLIFNVLGFNAKGESVVPEAAIELYRTTQSNLDEKRAAILKRLEAKKAENPKINKMLSD